MSDFADKTVLVTGGAGFLGSRIVARLHDAGARVLVIRSRDYDLRDAWHAHRLFDRLQSEGRTPQIVFHLAATVGGIGATSRRPANFLYDNLMMGMNVINECHKIGVGKLIVAGSVCAYPKRLPAPFLEANLWEGEPEETNGPYGVAKRTLLTALQSYRAQYGMNGIYLLLTNLYGEGDNFSDDSSHVIPALIKRFCQAAKDNAPVVTVWGSGNATRDFLYVEDAANAFMQAAKVYNNPEPLNIGSGQEISIANLVTLIAETTGYKGDIVWDRSKPDGQPRRVLDTHAAKFHLDWQAQTRLRTGIAKTVTWWQEAQP